jgi:hypothetical protein
LGAVPGKITSDKTSDSSISLQNYTAVNV